MADATYLDKLLADLKGVLSDHTCDVSGEVLLRSYNTTNLAELQQSHRAIDRVKRLLAEIGLDAEAEKLPSPKPMTMPDSAIKHRPATPPIGAPGYTWPSPKAGVFDGR